jgi:hypothetical protein
MTPPQFLIIPYQLVQDPNTHSLDERVYGIIYWLTQLRGERCVAGNKTLANLCKTTPTSLGNSLTRLERQGYILRIYKDDDKKVRKEIQPLIIFTRVSPTDDTQVSPTSDTRVSPTGEQKNSILSNNKHLYSNINVIKKPSNIKPLISYFFELKGWAKKDKDFYKKEKIIYARYTRPAKDLLGLCENNLEDAKKRLLKIKKWADEKGLEFGIETAIKRWLESSETKELPDYYKEKQKEFLKKYGHL